MHIVELKIDNDEKTDEMKAWGSQIDDNLKEFKPFIEKLKKQLGITQKKSGQQTGGSGSAIQVGNYKV